MGTEIVIFAVAIGMWFVGLQCGIWAAKSYMRRGEEARSTALEVQDKAILRLNEAGAANDRAIKMQEDAIEMLDEAECKKDQRPREGDMRDSWICHACGVVAVGALDDETECDCPDMYEECWTRIGDLIRAAEFTYDIYDDEYRAHTREEGEEDTQTGDLRKNRHFSMVFCLLEALQLYVNGEGDSDSAERTLRQAAGMTAGMPKPNGCPACGEEMCDVPGTSRKHCDACNQTFMQILPLPHKPGDPCGRHGDLGIEEGRCTICDAMARAGSAEEALKEEDRQVKALSLVYDLAETPPEMPAEEEKDDA